MNDYRKQRRLRLSVAPGVYRLQAIVVQVADFTLGGELVLMVDEGETTVHPGDVVIQRNTLHAWRNDTTAPVYCVAVLVPIQRQIWRIVGIEACSRCRESVENRSIPLGVIGVEHVS
jgi:hypothetical protein